MMIYLLLAGIGFVAWIVSTVGGGGGAMLLVPLIGFIAGARAVAPVTALATLIAGGGRVLVFRKGIEWGVVVWALPGALIGAVGPVLNILYLNAGITRERMVGTKTAVSFPMHLVKIGTYSALGALSGRLLLFGVAAGAGALASNWIGKRLLERMSERDFRGVIIAFMALSGLVMIWGQRGMIF